MKKITLFILTILYVSVSYASHITGGDMQYKCLGDNNYEIDLSIYRDCFSGTQMDNPANITIFNLDNNTYQSRDVTITILSQIPNVVDPCIQNPPNTCIETGLYRFTVNLPLNTKGYEIQYQRCCRNAGILNIFDSGNEGSTYHVNISRAAMLACNNSPKFNADPPKFLCASSTFSIDMSAKDTSINILKYYLSAPLFGGNTSSTPYYVDNMAVFPTPPPYSSLYYDNGYTQTNPFGNNEIQLDSITGLLTGITPSIAGIYALNVIVKEFAGSVQIGEISRDFQILVDACSKIEAKPLVDVNPAESSVQINDSTFISCKSKTIKFKNVNNATATYYWDFGVPGILSDTSILKNPTYTYSDTGVYFVTLIINKGKSCSDTNRMNLTVYEGLDLKFSVLPNCIYKAIEFKDSTTSLYNDINGYKWNFGDGDSVLTKNATHFYNSATIYNAKITVTTSRGCLASKTIPIEVYPKPTANFTFINACLKTKTIFTNTSTVKTGSINNTNWTFNNKDTSSQNNPKYIFPNLGNQTVQLIVNSDKNCKDTIQKNILINDSIKASFEINNIIFCKNEPLNFASTSKGKNLTYNWIFENTVTSTDSATKYTFTTAVTKNIQLVVTNTICGNDTASKSINITDLAIVDLGNDKKLCPQNTTIIKTDASQYDSIFWSNGSKSDSVTVTTTNNPIILTAYKDGCKNQDTLILIPDCEVFLPTAFSPNNDGINDKFNLMNSNVKTYKLKIYNRWGEFIFETTDFNIGWNGKHKNKDSEIDTYIYIAEGIKNDDTPFFVKGIFNLFR